MTSDLVEPDLRDVLHEMLGDRYRIGRELGGGGMSRVFLAVEEPLARDVVIKVLPPDLACRTSIARFEQEVALSVRLQHPHILPLLTAGGREDVRYHVTPYLPSESLRDRLRAAGRLPPPEVVRLLREMADAVAYAHAHGVVHRDIKPANVLLSDGHAVLADFGIAKAIAPEVPNGPDGRPGAWAVSLTAPDARPGTPDYMPPEPQPDERGDVYALAVVGYEMLTGAVPPRGAPAGALLAGAPAPLRAVLLRGLAADPQARFRSAIELLDALDALPPLGARAPRWAWAAAGTAAVLALVVAWGAWRARPAAGGAALNDDLIAVAPFVTAGPDAALWREGLMDVLAQNLDGAGPLRAVPASTVLRAWRERPDGMTPRELAEGTRARFVVRGTLLPVGDSLRLRATVLDAADGARLTEVDLRGDAHGVDRMADSLTMETLRAVAQVMPLVAVRLRQPSLGTRSLVALKAFLQGEQYYRTNRLDSAQHSYERAIQKDSGFALAYSRMRSVLRATAAEDDPRSMWFALRAAERSRGLSPRDSLLVLADSLYAAATEFARATPPWHALVRRRLRTLEQLTQRYPDDPEGWHELGEARHHHGESVAIDQRQALDAFGRAIALDPDFTPSYFHAVELSLGMGDVAGARSYLAAYLRPDRSDSALAFVRRLLDDSTARASGAVWDSLPLAVAARAAYAIRRWPDAAEPALRAYDRLRSTIHAPDEWMVDSLSLRIFALAERLYRGHVADAYAAADGALLAASPPFYVQHLALLDAMPVGVADSLFSAWSHGSDARRRVLALAWWAKRRDDRALAETGRACAKASRRAALVEPSARLAPPTAQQRAAQQTAALGEYCVAVTAAYRALVAGDTAGAIDAFAAVPDSLCQWGCVADRLARARLLIAVGHDRDAAAVLDARPPMPDALSAGDALWSFERARVAERLADTARAVAAYRAVAETWRHADAPLQRYVRDARNALARLRRAAG